MTNEEIYKQVKPYTICSKARVYATINAVKHVISCNIEGDIVECGVYMGGQIMAILLTLNSLGEERNVYLYDTFEGMPSPEKWEQKNKSSDGAKAIDRFNKLKLDNNTSNWCRSSMDEVMFNVSKVPYGVNKLHFVKGMVEDTLPISAHGSISLLRLDTDWYSSTKTELELLYPKLEKNGVLILDDYGHWSGAKKATDEYFAGQDIKMNIDDVTGRTIIK